MDDRNGGSLRWGVGGIDWLVCVASSNYTAIVSFYKWGGGGGYFSHFIVAYVLMWSQFGNVDVWLSKMAEGGWWWRGRGGAATAILASFGVTPGLL